MPREYHKQKQTSAQALSFSAEEPAGGGGGNWLLTFSVRKGTPYLL